jgi:hypothetical protein
MENIAQADAAAEMGEQYSLAKILGIWALAAIPMGILSWVVFPAVSPARANYSTVILAAKTPYKRQGATPRGRLSREQGGQGVREEPGPVESDVHCYPDPNVMGAPDCVAHGQ